MYSIRRKITKFAYKIFRIMVVGAAFISWSENNYQLRLSMMSGTVRTLGVMLVHIGGFGGDASEIIGRIDIDE